MKQITEDYVSYEIAKLLEEKGFDELSTVFYNEDGTDLIELYDYEPLRNSEISGYARITQSLALKWLREVHKLHIYAIPYWPQGDMRNKMSWQGLIVDLNTINGDSQCYAASPEEAIEDRVRFVLENLI